MSCCHWYDRSIHVPLLPERKKAILKVPAVMSPLTVNAVKPPEHNSEGQ